MHLSEHNRVLDVSSDLIRLDFFFFRNPFLDRTLSNRMRIPQNFGLGWEYLTVFLFVLGYLRLYSLPFLVFLIFLPDQCLGRGIQAAVDQAHDGDHAPNDCTETCDEGA
jgi:hypothetical protein